MEGEIHIQTLGKNQTTIRSLERLGTFYPFMGRYDYFINFQYFAPSNTNRHENHYPLNALPPFYILFFLQKQRNGDSAKKKTQYRLYHVG